MNIPFAIPECHVARFVKRHEDCLVIPARLPQAAGPSLLDPHVAYLTEPWSSGRAEGRIDRLKLIERRCYRRARSNS